MYTVDNKQMGFIKILDASEVDHMLDVKNNLDLDVD